MSSFLSSLPNGFGAGRSTTRAPLPTAGGQLEMAFPGSAVARLVRAAVDQPPQRITRLGDCGSSQAPVQRLGITLSTPRGAPVQSHPPPSSRRIDEAWLQQWIAFGMLDMAIYLARHAKFAAYLANRDQSAKRRGSSKKH